VKRFVVSASARRDLGEIAAHTKKRWGLRQTDRYLEQLEDGFHLLAQGPTMGRACKTIDSGLRRFEVGRHEVSYRVREEDIRIIRILHQQLIPQKTHFES
jgi:toxin ParE1/3/4